MLIAEKTGADMDIAKIMKRDGRLVEFDLFKIAAALFKAFIACGANKDMAYCERLARDVEQALLCEGNLTPSVEDIQDVAENILMQRGHIRIAKAYILYRAERTRVREMNTRLMKIYEDITFKDANESDIKRENANVNGDTAMGAMLKYGSEGAKQFYEMYLLNPAHSKAHKSGDIHIHDLDFLAMTTTCCQIDLTKLFKGGFCTGHGVLREPNDIASYSALACIAIQSNQNDQHGGQSLVSFDYDLAGGVIKTFKRKYSSNLSKALELTANKEITEQQLKEIREKIIEDGFKLSIADNSDYRTQEADYIMNSEFADGLTVEKLQDCQQYAIKKAVVETDKATYQAMEALIHNLNTMHSRAGAQTPFSSINYGMDVSEEGRMVIKNVLLAHEAGLGRGETPIFPIHIFRVKEGVNFNPEDKNYDLFQLAMRVSAKRLFPNFAFVDAPFNIKYYKGTPETEIAYMGCRTRVIGNVYDPTREISNGRGNLSFTSINLPRIAINANKNIDWFYDDLDRKLTLCIDQLLERFEIQAAKRVKNFPFLMGDGIWIDSEKLGFNEQVREVLKHGTLSVGFIGLAEALTALVGVHHGQSEMAQNLGLDIISHIRDRMDQESERRKMNFTLLATPAEGLSGRFVKLDRQRFGVIEGVTDKDYYTNSFHVPVGYKINAIDKIKLEAPYHALTNAGHITYVEMDGDPLKNPKVFEKIIRAMHDNGIGYGSINHPIDRDEACGYTGIIDDQCPGCGRHEGDAPFQRIRRITGYLVGTLDRFNNAKRKEVGDRTKHHVGE